MGEGQAVMVITRQDALRGSARLRVQREMSERGWNIADLAREAGLDPGTVGDFINGPRWPQYATRSKISRALGWAANGLDQLADGEQPALASETVSRPDLDMGVLLSMPPEALEGLGPAEREEVIAAAKLSALRAAREIRRRLDEDQDR